METADLIWQNGDLVPWEEAKTHVLSHGLHYGTGVFEGIRCYETDHGPAIFRHEEHLKRLKKSAELYYMKLPYTEDELRQATHELIRRNDLPSCYIRPIAFNGPGELGLDAKGLPIEVIIAAFPWGVYLGEDGNQHGIRTKVSSWRTISGDSLIPHAKAAGQYLNSILAKSEASNAGYDEAILLDQHGHVSEGSGENVFVVRNGVLSTPGPTSAILDGITRSAVIEIAKDLDEVKEVEQREVARAELYIADEVFLTGTAAEIVPVRSVDDHDLGEPGGITSKIQAKFSEIVRGQDPKYSHWLDYVEMSVRTNEPARVGL